MPPNSLKKAQTQNLETIAVTIFLIILLTISIYFFGDFKIAGLQSDIDEQTRQESLNTVETVISLDTLRCLEFNSVETGCMDYHRIQGFAARRETMESLLFDRLGFATAKIDLIGEENYTLYDVRPDEVQSRYTVIRPILIEDVVGLSQENKPGRFIGEVKVTVYE